MALSEVRPVVEDFVCDDSNELLLLKGKWGVGKTYFWHDLIEELSDAEKIGSEQYAYVSLFGVNNLDELKNAIFAERVRAEDIAGKSSLNVLQSNLKQVFNWVNDTSIPEEIGSYAAIGASIVNRAAFANVKKTLICFDDLERMGEQISWRELLGLMTMLKEQRDCKVAIIYNEGSLSEEKKEAFRRHSEKIVDIELEFSQSPEEAFGCAFKKSDEFYGYLRKYCLKIGIENIRILQRIQRFTEKLEPFLDGRETQTVQKVIHILVLYVWCYYDKDQEAPNWGFMRAGNQIYLSMLSSNDLSEEEKRWNELLREYDYHSTQALDLCIANLIEQGYLNESDLKRELDREDEKARSGEGRRSYIRVMEEKYYNTFANNEDVFTEELLDAFQSNMSYMSPSDLNNVVSFLRDFGRNESANELIDEYVSRHEGKRILDLGGYPFRDKIGDQYLKERFEEAVEKISEERTLSGILKRVVGEKGWSKDDEKFLASCSADQYYRFFKTEESELLRPSVKRCMGYGRLHGADEFQQAIYEKAKQALQKIAGESRINRLRLSAFDIEPEGES